MMGNNITIMTMLAIFIVLFVLGAGALGKNTGLAQTVDKCEELGYFFYKDAIFDCALRVETRSE